MDKTRYFGAGCAIIAEMFGVAYLIDSIVVSNVTGATASLVASTLIQVALVIAMLMGFFSERKRLLFGALMISMAYNGIAYFLNDIEVCFPFDRILVDHSWAEATDMLIYFAVDFLWAVAVIFVFFATFAKAKRLGFTPSIVLFFILGGVLLVNSVFGFIASAQSSTADPTVGIGCLGDGFTLFEYALGLMYCFNDKNAVADAGVLPEKEEIAEPNDGKKEDEKID
jgi:hypothetical protein